MVGPEIIAIGASAGGVSAVQNLLRGFGPVVRAPIVVVQHLARSPRTDLSMVYVAGDARQVVEVEDKMSIQPMHVYMASPDYHLLVEKDRTFALTQDEPMHFSRPSIDVFFRSVAEVYGEGAVGILLTGANRDGADGLCRIRDAGGLTIVQSPETAEVSVMPRAALDLCEHDEVLPLEKISSLVSGLFDGPVGRKSMPYAKTERGNPHEN